MNLLDELSRFVDATERVEPSIENMAAVLLWNIAVSLTKKDNNHRQEMIIKRFEKQVKEAGIDSKSFATIKEWVTDFVQKQPTTSGDDQFFDIHEKIYGCLQELDVKIMSIETLED